MVSKIVLTFFVGQILLAILFFYLLPISSASKYQKSTVKIEKSSKPIINLKQGKNNFLQSIIFSYYSITSQFMTSQFTDHPIHGFLKMS